MRTITQTLNMTPGGVPPVIHVSQYDSDFTITFTLFSLFGGFTIESGTTAQIRGTKSSGTGYSADAAINISAKTVTVTGNAQMTAAAGQNIFEIVLKKNNKEISSKNFILHVERAALDADTITDESVLKELDAIIEGAETATQAAEEAEDAADRAEAAAQSLVIDSTPTQGSSRAVSSGGVWDEIADLKSDLNNLVLPDNRVITNYDTAQKTYTDTRIALTGTVVSGYTWNKSTSAQDTNSGGKYARFDNIGQYETLYVSGADIDANHRLYAFYTANGTLLSAKSGTGTTGSVQVPATVPENADYVIVNTLYSTGDTGRDIDPACFALKVGEEDITADMPIAEGTVTGGYAWRPGQAPLQNSGCRYVRYNTVPDSDYIYITGRAYRVSAPLVSFYNSSDELISSYGANSLTYYEYIETAVPAGTSYFIVNGAGNTPIVSHPASNSKKTQREVNEDVNADLASIRNILDNIDPLSDVIKEALLNCFKYVYWIDDKGHDAYEELKEALMGTEYIYKLDAPLVVDGTTGYLVTDVAPFTKDRSFTMFIDYTEGGRDWTVSGVIADTIFQVQDAVTNKSVIASTFKTTNASNVTTRISIFGIWYAIRQPKESAGNRRIKYGISYDAESGKYTAVISVNGTIVAPYQDQTNTEVSFAETDAVINVGCSITQAEILKGTVNDLRILNHTTSQADLTAYVTSLD